MMYFIAFFGIRIVDDTYIHSLNILTQTFVVIFLLYRFHPFRTEFILKPVDRTIVFGSAILLGTNLLLTNVFSIFVRDFVSHAEGTFGENGGFQGVAEST
jgi:hypothetical protein